MLSQEPHCWKYQYAHIEHGMKKCRSPKPALLDAPIRCADIICSDTTPNSERLLLYTETIPFFSHFLHFPKVPVDPAFQSVQLEALLTLSGASCERHTFSTHKVGMHWLLQIIEGLYFFGPESPQVW